MIRDGLCEKRLSCTRCSVENDTLRRLDTHLLVELGMHERQLDGLSDFLDLLLQSTDIRVRLRWCLVQLHDRDKRISIIG